MSMTADTVVVGGGVNGASIAYRLARAGQKVVLCERYDFASGATGACDQAVFLQSKNPGIHLRLAMDSSAMLRNLSLELDHEIDYFQHGGMITIENEMEMEVMKRFAGGQRKIGLEVEIIDRDEAVKHQRGLGKQLLGCTYSSQDGHINPFKLTLGFIKAAKRYGARCLIDAEVAEFKRNGDRVTGIKTPREEVDAETVILAAGAWTPLLGEKLGLSIPIKPRRGQIVITEPVAPYIRGNLLSAQYIVAKYHPETLAASADRGVRLGVGLSLTQTVKGDVLIGASREFAGYNLDNTRETIREILKNAVRLVPGLANMQVIRVMAGLRPYTPDGLPLVGYVKKLPGLFLAAGHEGDGIALSAVTGRIVAELVTEGRAYTDVSPLDPDRFELTA
ncbi:MAG: FAD-binding oxidoreductase [Treponema sp.]|jgi:sarcosine oxidase subunit beta|nr:FAD-binding oxidoreductase [Treponema sp.]